MAMKTLTLKEAQALYDVLDTSQATLEPILVERDGKPIGVFVPMAEYEAFCAWREAARPQKQLAYDEAFQREAEAFERIKPQLLKTHLGKAVAVYHGEIVAVGETKVQVYEQVTTQFGEAPIYIQVIEEHPRIYKISGPRLVHQ
jgi:PHD/YefM family antitoxin component YafN of YafNO toxin-antitoxin module